MADGRRDTGIDDTFGQTLRLFERLREGYKAPEDLTVSEWADKYRILSPENSAEAGRWKTSRVPYMKEIMDAFTDPRVKTLVAIASSQVGKALAIDTPIPTPDGWKTMGELQVGDTVFGDNGRPCKVTFISGIMYDHRCYEVTFSDGSKIVADAGHKWYVQSETALEYYGKRRKAIYDGVLQTEVIAHSFKWGKKRNRYAIPVAKPIWGEEKDLPIKPYTLGAWLGDGHSYSSQISEGTQDTEEIAGYIKEDGYDFEIVPDKNNTCTIKVETKDVIWKQKGLCIRGHKLAEVGLTKDGYCAECSRQHSKHSQYGFVVDPIVIEPMTTRLRKMGLIENKHIPEEYLRASIEQRVALLNGIMDTDGTVDKRGRCAITLKSKRLIMNVKELLLSLGFKPVVKKDYATFTYNGQKKSMEVYDLSFMAYAEELPVFRLKRKAARIKSMSDGYRRVSETKRRRIVDVKEVPSVPVQCIQVDNPTHLYLAGDAMIPTHNTEVLANMLGFMIDQDPGPAMYCVPTKEFAEDFSKRRIAPMIRDTKALAEKVGDAKGRNTNNTITKKTYPGGMISLIGSNSPTDLAGTPARYIFADEIDRWAKSAGTEGDPWSLLERRTTTFYNAKMVAVSTPTIKDHSKIEDLYNLGTKEKWCVKCPHCGEYHFITFDNIRFKHKKIETGGQVQFSISDICYLCPDCGATSTENEIKRAEKKWIAESPEALANGTRSFWINGFYSPWNTWETIILRFLEATATKDVEKLKTVYNTLFGELWEDRTELEDISGLMARREDYGAELPDGVLCLTMGVDTQDDWLEYEVVGHGFWGETWGIQTGRIPGKPLDDAVWEQLDAIRDKEWLYKDGTALRISLTFIDRQGHFNQEVRERCAERMETKIFCVEGSNKHDAPYTSKPKKDEYRNPRTNRYGFCWCYRLGVDAGKEHIMSALKVQEPGPKYCHFPKERGYEEDYFNGLLSERLVFDKNGKPKWEKITLRNEPLDCRNYANAAFRVLNPSMDKLKAARYDQKPKKKIVRQYKPYRTDIYGKELL